MTDVCLILEGTYPYTPGGVSVCVYNLIKNLPQISFSIVHITPTGDTPRALHYPLPPNIKEFKELFLFDLDFKADKNLDRTTENDWNKIIEFHKGLKSRNISKFEDIYNIFFHPQHKKIDLASIFSSKQAWETLKYLYLNSRLEHSFNDFFWNWRFIHYPLFKVLSYTLPQSKIYHTMCTGYAGALSASAKLQTQRPVILTEHGIYTTERQLEISQADWIVKVPGEATIKAQRTSGFFKQWWINVFNVMGLLTYHYADNITTIFEGNREKQIEQGARADKTRIIPNGINVELYKNLRTEKDRKENIYRIGFVGRVVPIKDIKTFIRAIKIVHEHSNQIEVLILGPTVEDPKYFEECQTLANLLQIETVIQFKGNVKLQDYYKHLDVIVLTSISEGVPLVILEANAAGIPVVATNVGGCRELLHGRTEEDQQLGKSGIITLPASPKETADALIKLMDDKNLRYKMGMIGQKRMESFYKEKDVVDQYHILYQSLL
jgi:polysaccharide biosynthesis protein PelF